MFIDHLNHRYLITKAKLSDREVRWMEKLIAFDFTIIYCKEAKNLIDGLFRQSDFKNDNELFTTRRQLLLNFLSKFQKYLKGTKSDPAKE